MINYFTSLGLENLSEEIDGVLHVEEWLPVNVPIYREGYLVSSFGRVKGIRSGIIRKPYLTPEGYLRVNLVYNGVFKCFYPHILVAKTFLDRSVIENIDAVVNHKKGVKTDNRKWELEWTTQSGNIIHAFETGLSKVGESHGMSKFTNEQVLEIFHSKEKRKTISAKYGISMAAIKQIKLGKTWCRLTNKHYHKAENTSRRHLSNEDVLSIFRSNEKTGVLRKKYGISNESINNIKRGDSFPELTKNEVRGHWHKKSKAA